MRDPKKAEDFVYLIGWAIQRILRDEYDKTLDAKGNLETLELSPGLGPNRPISGIAIEKVLRSHFPPEKVEALLALKEERTKWQLEEALRSLFTDSELASRAAQELEGSNWEEVLLFVDEQLLRLEEQKLREHTRDLIVQEREGLSGPVGKEVYQQLEASYPEELSLFTARKYAKELRDLLPTMVRRAEEIRLVPTTKQVPAFLNQYLTEATRCYLYGHFLASLMVCRSAVEEGVRQKLIGMSEVVKERESLCELLDRAKGKLLDSTRWGHAEEIRKKGRNAVHGKEIPTHAECIDALIKTRGILEHLFGRIQ